MQDMIPLFVDYEEQKTVPPPIEQLFFGVELRRPNTAADSTILSPETRSAMPGMEALLSGFMPKLKKRQRPER